ncbi:MAG: sodium:proton antiporter [Aquificae bacterium]|nr:sodium:proton antiporter [Aquificota bacterium]
MESGTLLFVFFGFALVAPFLANALRMPVPVGELLLGLLIGSLLTGELPAGLSFLAHLGFLLLMFMAGLEVDFNLLSRTPPKALAVYFLYAAGVPSSGVLVAILLGLTAVEGLLLSFVSVGLLLAVLKELKLPASFTQRVLVIGAVGEVLSLFVLSYLHALKKGSALEELLKLSFFFAGFFFVFYAVKTLLWWFPETLTVFVKDEDREALGIRLSLFLAFAGAFAARSAGIEDALGAFLAGVVVSYFVRKKKPLEEALSAVGYGFLVPLFFLKTGLELKLSSLGLKLLLEVLLLAAAALLARLLPAFLLLPAGFTPAELYRLALLLSFPFTLQVVGTELAHAAGLLDDAQALRLYLTALFSSLFFPWLAKALK